MTDLNRLSTYRVPVSVYDENDAPLDVSTDDVVYQMNEKYKAGDTLFSFQTPDSHIDMSYGDVHEFRIEIDAQDMDVPEEVYEEVRVNRSDGTSDVVVQRKVDFNEVVTEP